MRSLDCSRDVPFAENTRQFVDEETYDAVVLARLHQLDAIFTIFGGSDRDKCLILQR